jgi:UPF0755 protein
MFNKKVIYRTIITSFFIAFLLFLSVYFLINNKSINNEYSVNEKSNEEYLISIQSGDSGLEIAKLLEKNGIIKDYESFYNLAINDNRALKISPGDYMINKKISSNEALDQLLDKDRLVSKFLIKEGERLIEISDKLSKYGFLNVTNTISSYKLPDRFKEGSLEGLLFPAKYNYYKGMSVKEFLDIAVRGFIDYYDGVDKDLAISSKYSDLEILIIASIIQSEGSPDNYSKVAEVIYNRLDKKMPLQMDSTINYVKNSRGEIYVSNKDLAIDSPYNTYRNLGLPPTAISNPGKLAIDAALNPTKGDNLYFVTIKPGVTKFSTNYDGFLRDKRVYQENYKKGLFD